MSSQSTGLREIDPNLKNADHLHLGQIVQEKLDAKQRAAWDMTRAALLWNCPAFTHILFTMMTGEKGDVAIFTKQVPTAGTDGKNLLINPEFFFKRNLQERVFICAHEIAHAIFNHCGQMWMFRQRGHVPTSSGKKLEYNDQLMNIAMDLVINDLLIEAKVGQFVQGGLHDKQYGVAGDSIIDVYEKVHKDAKGCGKGPSGQGFDAHMAPGTGDGKDAQDAQSERSDIEWQTACAAAAASAKAQGKLPAALERFFQQMLEPAVSWEEKIRSFFARKVGSGSYDWRKPDRRLIVQDIYAPGRSGFGAGTVVVGVDTSGSIGQLELDQFFGEMRGILGDVRPKQLIVLWCDAKVHKADFCEEVSDLDGLKPHGGGGTDFNPVFDWITNNQIEPDALVYLTDGYGSFPGQAPKYPVLWGDIMCGKGVKYPWGDVVEIPIKGK